MMRMLTKLLLVLLLYSFCLAETYTRYVDPDVAVGTNNGRSWATAYTNLSAGEQSEMTDLVSDGNSCIIRCRSSGGTADSSAVTIDGWNTDATHTLTIIGHDFPSDGIYDNTAYRLEGDSANVGFLEIADNYVTLRNLQLKVGDIANSDAYAIRYNIADNCTVDSCIVMGTFDGTGNTCIGIQVIQSDNFNIYNTIVADCVDGAEAYRGIRIGSNTTDTGNIYNCTFYNNYVGILQANSAVVNVYNTAVGVSNDDFSGSFNTIDYCCSDDGDGNHPQSPVAVWSGEFTDANNDDFSLLVTANCVGNGTDDPSSGLYSDDITDTARSSTWDIGATEYGSGASTNATQIIGKLDEEDIFDITNMFGCLCGERNQDIPDFGQYILCGHSRN